MISLSCLIKDTQLYKDVSDFIMKSAMQRAASNKKVDIESMYGELRAASGLTDVDMESFAYIYDKLKPSLVRQGIKNLSGNKEIKRAAGKVLDEVISDMLTDKTGKTQLDQVGRQKPTEAVISGLLRMFDADFYDNKPNIVKTQMKQMQEALMKGAKNLLDRKGKKTNPKATPDEILREALRIDASSIRTLKGSLNDMQSMFDQLAEEKDKVIKQLQKSKVGQSQAKQNEIDQKIRAFEAYTNAIQTGAYSLALSNREAFIIMRDIMKVPFGKDIVVNGVTKRVLDLNKMYASGANFELEAEKELINRGFSQQEAQRAVQALKREFDNLRQSAQWQNIADGGVKRAVEDDAFLTRAAANVVMSKVDSKGKAYQKYDTRLERNVPDWDRWFADTQKTIDQVKQEIKTDIQTKGNASAFRQVVSELARKNQYIPNFPKSDLQTLSEMQQRGAFGELYNAKVADVLGIDQNDVATIKEIEELTKKLNQIYADPQGFLKKGALSAIHDQINRLVAQSVKSKSTALSVANRFSFVTRMGNIMKIANLVNIVENTASAFSSVIQNQFQALDKENRRKEFQKAITVMADVAAGGRGYDIANVERVNFQTYESRFDTNKSLTDSENIRAGMLAVPNVIMGTMDAIAYSNTFMTMVKNSVIVHGISQRAIEEKKKMLSNGSTVAEADAYVKSKAFRDKAKKEVVDELADALYDETAYQDALLSAEQGLRLVKNNPTATEIKREADNIMLYRLVSENLLSAQRLKTIVKGAKNVSDKALGRKAKITGIPHVNVSLEKISIEDGKKIDEYIKKKQYGLAARRWTYSTVINKGLFAFASAAFNWTVIAGIRAVGGVPLYLINKRKFKDSLLDIAEMDDRQMLEVVEAYNNQRDNLYKNLVGLGFTSAFVTGLSLMYAMDGEDDDDFFDYIKTLYEKNIANNKFAKKALYRWLPDMLRFTLAAKAKDLGEEDRFIAANTYGISTLETPASKINQLYSKDPVTGAIMMIVSSASPISTTYSFGRSWNDVFNAFGEQEPDVPRYYKGRPSDNMIADALLGRTLEKENPLYQTLSGVLSGILGYRLNQDLNVWNGYMPKK